MYTYMNIYGEGVGEREREREREREQEGKGERRREREREACVNPMSTALNEDLEACKVLPALLLPVGER